MIATKVACELVRLQPETPRASTALLALAHTASKAGIDLVETPAYTGAADWLLVWGPGHPERAAIMRRHVAQGGHAIALDLAYWSRSNKVRMSIDAPHPQGWVMRKAWSPSRFEADRPSIHALWKQDGPIMIAGIGLKAQIQYGASIVEAWQEAMLDQCRQRWPHRHIILRPKPATGVLPPVEGVLRGVSLVITWHSNIAVDAIRCGIPVVCRDGAAAAVCPAELPADDPRPLSFDLRDRFLANLAYFQWAPYEAAAQWQFLRELLA